MDGAIETGMDKTGPVVSDAQSRLEATFELSGEQCKRDSDTMEPKAATTTRTINEKPSDSRNDDGNREPSITKKTTTICNLEHRDLRKQPEDNRKHKNSHHLNTIPNPFPLSTFWLPLIMILLLPQFKINHNNSKNNNYCFDAPTTIVNNIRAYSTSQFVLDLLQFPFERFQLNSLGGPLLGYAQSIASNHLNHLNHSPYVGKVSQIPQQQQHTTNGQQVANSITDRQDLVEEESNMLLMNPGETLGGQRAGVYSDQSSLYRQQAISPVGPQTQYESIHPGFGQESAQQPTDNYAIISAASSANSAEQGSNGVAAGGTAAELQLQSEASSLGASNSDHLVASRQRTAPMTTNSGALQTRADLPTVSALNVKCEKNHMKVNIVFDRPFYGVVFSKGHYNDKKCVHLPPNSGQTTVNFEINMGKCGLRDSRQTLLNGGQLDADGAEGDATSGGLTTDLASQQQQQQQPHGVYIENTIVIQYDSQVQEIYDQARRLRCTWYDYYEKSVTFRPYDVEMLDAVTANFLGDNIQCWMQIQVGKGPKSSEVAGLVKIGQSMTMVLAIKDDENRFDMLVRNCIAHDGKHAPIQLVDEYGCVARPKIMGQFQKSRNFGPQATVVSYAHFQAFKFPDSLSVHFQCVIQVCRSECPPLNCNDQANGASNNQPSGDQPPTLLNRNNQPGHLGSQTVGFGMGLSNSANDYATSGTENVATKEQLPQMHHLHQQHQATMQQMLMSPHQQLFQQQQQNSASGYPLMPMSSNHSVQIPPNYHQIKLDESQGRVQVKLDTSMLSGNRYQTAVVGSQAIGGGAAPPPTLQSSLASSAAPGSSSGGLATPISGFQLPRGQTHRYQSGLVSSTGPSHQQIFGATGSAPASYKPGGPYGSQVPPGGRVSLLSNSNASQSSQRGPQALNYSPQYPSNNMVAAASASPPSMVQRAAYATNRIGELAPGARSMQDEINISQHQQQQQHHDSAAKLTLSLGPETTGSDLSLLATPRALRSDGQILIGSGDHHRYRRSLPSENPQSTSIQTQKTIQVISPEDVAFSLNGGQPSQSTVFGDNDGGISITQSSSSAGNRDSTRASESTTVCFSAVRFLVGILFAMSLLIISLVVAALLLFRQQQYNKIHKKELQFVSPPYGTSTACDPEPFPGAHLFEHQQHQAQTTQPNQTDYSRRFVGGYLNRIYTQFSPHSSGWHS